MFILVSSHSIIFYLFLSQMAGDKRKGKAVAEQKKKKSKQQEWERMLAVPDTQGQPQRGIRILKGTQTQGEQPQSEQQQQQPEQQTWQQQQPRRSGRGHQTTERCKCNQALSGFW
jgi:hypothetical protein